MLAQTKLDIKKMYVVYIINANSFAIFRVF